MDWLTEFHTGYPIIVPVIGIALELFGVVVLIAEVVRGHRREVRRIQRELAEQREATKTALKLRFERLIGGDEGAWLEGGDVDKVMTPPPLDGNRAPELKFRAWQAVLGGAFIFVGGLLQISHLIVNYHLMPPAP